MAAKLLCRYPRTRRSRRACSGRSDHRAIRRIDAACRGLRRQELIARVELRVLVVLEDAAVEAVRATLGDQTDIAGERVGILGLNDPFVDVDLGDRFEADDLDEIEVAERGERCLLGARRGLRTVNGEAEPAGRQPIQRDACAATRAADLRARADVQEVGPVTPGKRHLPNFERAMRDQLLRVDRVDEGLSRRHGDFLGERANLKRVGSAHALAGGELDAGFGLFLEPAGRDAQGVTSAGQEVEGEFSSRARRRRLRGPGLFVDDDHRGARDLSARTIRHVAAWSRS